MLKACLRAAEADAAPNEWGVMCPAGAPIQAGRTLFGRNIYPKMVETIQLLGTSSLMALPAEADFDAAIAPEVNQYLATDTSNARDRARLFHLAWDVSCSAFSGRQVLYERMFGGSAVRNAMTLFNTFDREPYSRRVRDFLESSD
jgi:4-hydroxyphenylacetate 3-monooxygenase